MSQEPQRMQQAHIKFLMYHLLKALPHHYKSLDPQRIVVMYFSLIGLDILNALPMVQTYRDDMINFVYSLQSETSGFSGSPLLRAGSQSMGHLAPTYSAICILKTLGDDLSRVNRSSIVSLIKHCIVVVPRFTEGKTTIIEGNIMLRIQAHMLPCNISEDPQDPAQYDFFQSDLSHHTCQQLGSFYASPLHDEYDVRFMYCVMALCEMLELWEDVEEYVSVPRIFAYLTSCQTYEGGFGLTDCGQEAHGGATHTALMSYYLMLNYIAKRCNKSPQTTSHNIGITKFDINRITKFLIARQGGDGYSGRTNKDEDTCYSYWLGSLLPLFGIDHFSRPTDNSTFLEKCQDPVLGGFAKEEDAVSEILHTFYSLAGLSLLGEGTVTYPNYHPVVTDGVKFDLNRIDPVLGITVRASGIKPAERLTFQELFEMQEDKSKK